jgi:hypothetical protein
MVVKFEDLFLESLNVTFIKNNCLFRRSEVIDESCSKEGLESEIESEKLVESTTEKETKDKDIDETVVVRRRQKRQTQQTTLPPGAFSLNNC